MILTATQWGAIKKKANLSSCQLSARFGLLLTMEFANLPAFSLDFLGTPRGSKEGGSLFFSKIVGNLAKPTDRMEEKLARKLASWQIPL
jgi:hypothetical protein